jgi:NADPH:quinone reductase-like Zn-dependent oxidoreductase
VFGMPNIPKPSAAYDEFVTASSHHFVAKPANLTYHEAAALPLVGLSAWQALVDTAHVLPGQTVLVHGAAGGVGHIAVQVAKALGARVIATASAEKHDLVWELGADEVHDYRNVIIFCFARKRPQLDICQLHWLQWAPLGATPSYVASPSSASR